MTEPLLDQHILGVVICQLINPADMYLDPVPVDYVLIVKVLTAAIEQ